MFSGNAAAHALEPWFTRQTTVANCLLAEHRLSGAWLRLVSPLARIRLEGGIVTNASALVCYATGPDVTRTDFPVVEARDVTLHLLAAPDPAEVHGQNITLAPPLERPPDPGALAARARRGQPPDLANCLRFVRD